MTVVNNMVIGNDAEGGGIYTNSANRMVGAVLANNSATNGAPDLRATIVDPSATLPGVAYSLIVNPEGSPLATGGGGAGNLLYIDPMLGPLADNGGSTLTHAPLPGSPLVDAGDPSVTAVPMNVSGFGFFPSYLIPGVYDQRGQPFDRAVDGGSGTVRIDIGAVEVQAPAAGGAMFDAGSLAAMPYSVRARELPVTPVAVDEALAEAENDDLLLVVRVDDLLVDNDEAESFASIAHDADRHDVFHDSQAGAAGLTLWGREPLAGF